MGGIRFGAREAVWLILAVSYGVLLAWNLPGHLTVDSVLALHEGRFGVRTTWNPAFFGWLLGVLDRIHRGTSLAVVLFSGLLFGAWALLTTLRPRVGWLAPVVALGVVALPQAMLYPAIVWKDVQFATAVVAGFALLAFGVRDRTRPTPWISLVVAALLFAAAGLLRQNGLLLALPAALAIAWARSAPGGWLRSSGLAVGWLVAVAALTLVLSAVAQPQGVGAPDDAGSKGVRILGTYDIVGAAALQPGRPTPHIDAESPATGAYLRAHAQQLYSAERVDRIGQDARMGALLSKVSSSTIRAEWLDLIRQQPGLYLRVRTQIFGQVIGTPIIDRCLPVTIGVDGPITTLNALEMPPRRSLADRKLYNYVTWFLDTPAMSHLAFAAIALVVGVALLFRREPADLVVAGLMAGALGFTASFFAISLACDYRYLYLLDVSAMTGLLYLALDPRLRRA